MNCDICTEPYTKRRNNIKCQYCEFTACASCYKIYLLSINKPKCMSNGCNGEWSRKHLRDNFTNSFISKGLREHEKKVIIETQMSLMPETQLVVERINHQNRINKKIKELIHIRSAKQREIKEYNTTTMGEYNNKKEAIANMSNFHTNYYGNQFITQIKNAIGAYKRDDTVIPDDGLLNSMSAILENYNKLSEQLQANSITIECNKKVEWDEHIEKNTNELNEIKSRLVRLENNRDRAHDTSRREFIKKCGDPECRGFLSTKWKCGLCEKKTCIDCHEVINDNITHVCDNNVVETIKLLKTDTKNCPKCQTNIFKIDGCDQMWCTQCKTGFSWSTGKIEMKLHNPHYYEWRRQNMGVIEREPGDNQQCITPNDILDNIISSNIEDELKTELIEMCRYNIQNSVYFTNPNVPNFETYRIQYLNKGIDIEELKSNLIRVNKAYSKKQELYTVYNLLSITFTDIMNRFCMELNKSILNELDTIIEYVNGCFDEISYSYGSNIKISVDNHMIIYKQNRT